MRSLRLGISKEEKVAVAIGRIISDFSLDLEAVGKYLATSNSYIIYMRVLEILEATEYNGSGKEYREIGKYYSEQMSQGIR
jgi:hypothetical protein